MGWILLSLSLSLLPPCSREAYADEAEVLVEEGGDNLSREYAKQDPATGHGGYCPKGPDGVVDDQSLVEVLISSIQNSSIW